MRKMHRVVRGAAFTGLLLAVANPALASEKDRARQAIVEADTKIQAVATATPEASASPLTVEAQSSLRDAKEQLGRGHERQAINAAMKASELADRAMAEGKQAQASAAAASDAANAAAQGAALDAAASAQAQAADANARAASAEQAANAAASDAAAARAQAAAAAAAPPPATTITTSTETRGATVTSGSGTVVKKAPVRKKVVTHTTRAVPATKTTTTVETKPQ